ncbi:hypothetical protein MTO96_010134 [Rhipicephalus appendiculatus]
MALASAPAAFSKSDSPTRIMTVFRSKSDDTSASLLSENEYREKLLRNVKKEVKQIMEEAVTRKFVHEESSSITSLCAAVDSCLSHGLKRRALGLFKTNSTTALLHKMAKHFEPAAAIARAVTQMEAAAALTSDSSTTESRLRSQTSRRSLWSASGRYIWIRLALFEKQLACIVDHLVHNSSKYYEKDALVADPVSGQILASLLVGPCALDYSKMKTQDHFWTDPPADELVQRHRLSSGLPASASAGGTAGTPPPTRRLGLQCRRDLRGTTGGSSSEEGSVGRVVGAPVGGGCDRLARDYVESLHQNARSTLLYGKNNVRVQPRCHAGEPLPGYLSLHQQGGTQLVLKWTPNQLMNGTTSGDSSSGDSLGSSQDKSIYWEYALSVNMEDIVYLHCHQQVSSTLDCSVVRPREVLQSPPFAALEQVTPGGTLVLVGQDGVQRPPMHFPRGGHLLAFLSCLENGLLPNGQLDPPLWTQQSGTGKVFPRLRRRRAAQGEEEEGSTDFVFRVITSLRPHSLEDLLEGGPAATATTEAARASRLLEARSSSSRSSESPPPEEESPGQRAQGQSLQLLCDTMKKQIISRAFYGWLAHCRHLRTEVWQRLSASGRLDDPQQLHRLVYFGGIEHQVRPLVWPYLLGHYALSSLPEERQERDASTQAQYEATLSEWLAAEAMVRHREGLHTKLSSESTTSEIPLIGPKDTHLSNEVFEDGSSDGGGLHGCCCP